MKKRNKNLFQYISGVLIGAANGLFGSGGGILAVPLLEKTDNNVKKAHATSVAVTLALSIVSSFIYFNSGNIDIVYALKFIPFGIAGAYIGTKLLVRLSNKTLKRIFGVVMIIFGLRLILR
ncbi:MAG: sulfite exporter TauE/SafE family protein [Oscillospiraceae bacterium]